MSTEAMNRTGDGQGARETASEAASMAKEEAASVARVAKEQAHSLLDEARHELQAQADLRSGQAAGQLRRWSGQVDALRAGRIDEAGDLPRYLREGQDKLASFADRLDQRGAQGVIDDIVGFGRRRPGLFLLAAGGLGLAVGRLARAGAAEAGSSPASRPAPVRTDWSSNDQGGFTR
jgi:hypothetical protein